MIGVMALGVDDRHLTVFFHFSRIHKETIITFPRASQMSLSVILHNNTMLWVLEICSQLHACACAHGNCGAVRKASESV
jgi:hypothetical protein